MLKDFGSHVEQVSRRLKEASLAEAEASGRPVRHLTSSQVSKEEVARTILAREGIRDGLVCVLSCVEPCWSFEIHRSREKKKLELEPRYRKCLFLDHYWLHPVFGFLNARIQTWFPFAVQVGRNGREWWARQMDAAGLEYVRQDNRFPWIADWAQAQRLMDRPLKAHGPKLLNGIARQLNPIHREIPAPDGAILKSGCSCSEGRFRCFDSSGSKCAPMQAGSLSRRWWSGLSPPACFRTIIRG